MTSLFDIVSQPRIRGGIRQVSGGTTAGPRWDKRWIKSRQVSGSAGGLEKCSVGLSGLVKKTLDCTVSFQVQGKENLLTRCWSLDQNGCHAHIW